MLFESWSEHRNCNVFSRYELTVGQSLSGPAVIEEAESTTVVGPNGKATVDADRNIVVTISNKVSR